MFIAKINYAVPGKDLAAYCRISDIEAQKG